MAEDDSGGEYFSEREKREIRGNVRKANAASMAEVLSRGVTVNPRIARNRKAEKGGDGHGRS